MQATRGDTIGQAVQITALILAGGAGRRVGGRDKGLLHWHGEPLVKHVYRRIAPQVTRTLISCNRNRRAYAMYGDLAPADLRADFQGPLAGLEAAIPALECDFVMLVPCDTPLLPVDLVARLQSALQPDAQFQVSYAATEGQGQFLCALLRRNALVNLGEFLDAGGRAARDWYATLGAIAVDFSAQRESFLNLNHLDRIGTKKPAAIAGGGLDRADN